MKIKVKKIAAINYFIFGVAIILAWFYYIPTPHNLKTTTDQLDALKLIFQKKTNIKLEMKVNNAPESLQLSAVYNNILKVTPEEQNSGIVANDKSTDSSNSIILNLECSKTKEINALEISSISNFIFRGDCRELETSKKLQREVKRVISGLTQGLMDDVNLNLAFELIHLNIYLITPVEDRNKMDPVKNNIIEVAGIFFKKLGLPQSQYRLNFQTVFLEDLPLEPKSGQNNSSNFSVQNLKHFVDSYPSISQEQVYTFETEDINWYIFTKKNTFFIDEEVPYTYFDEAKEKYAVMALTPQGFSFEVQVLRGLYRMFELTTLQELSSGLSALTLKYKTDVEFSLFNERRSGFLMRKIMQGLESFKFIVDDSELVIEKEVGEKIDEQLEKISQLKVDDLKLQDLKSIYRIVWTLNYDGNHKFGYRDSFTNDYRIGVYVPLMLPFFFPIIRILKRLRKSNKN